MKLIRGDRLPAQAKREVLEAFGYRWTVENEKRAARWRPHGHQAPTVALVSDEQWLATHAFWVTKAGALALNRRHAEPGFLADEEVK